MPSPRQTVIAGPPEQVDAVIAVVDAQGRLARRIEVDVASHHPTIDPILPELRSALADLAPDAPKIPLISTVGQTNGAAPTFDADYWAANLRNPVRFSQAVAAAGGQPRHLHRGQPASAAHPRHQREPGVGQAARRFPGGGNVEPRQPTKRSPSIPTWPRFGRRRPRCRKLPAAQKTRGHPADAVAAFEVLGRALDPPAGSRPVLIRCWGCTLKCRPAATMCGRQMSEPS